MRRDIGNLASENKEIFRELLLTALISSVSTSCNLSFLCNPTEDRDCDATRDTNEAERRRMQNIFWILGPYLHMKSCSVSLVCTLSPQIVLASIFMNITAVHRITGQFTEHDNLNKDLQTSYNQEHYHYHQPCQDRVKLLSCAAKIPAS